MKFRRMPKILAETEIRSGANLAVGAKCDGFESDMRACFNFDPSSSLNSSYNLYRCWFYLCIADVQVSHLTYAACFGSFYQQAPFRRSYSLPSVHGRCARSLGSLYSHALDARLVDHRGSVPFQMRSFQSYFQSFTVISPMILQSCSNSLTSRLALELQIWGVRLALCGRDCQSPSTG